MIEAVLEPQQALRPPGKTKEGQDTSRSCPNAEVSAAAAVVGPGTQVAMHTVARKSPQLCIGREVILMHSRGPQEDSADLLLDPLRLGREGLDHRSSCE